MSNANLQTLLAELGWLDALLQRAAGNGGGPLVEKPAATSDSRLATLSNVFGLTPFERNVVLLCIAPELDRNCGRLYSALQQDDSATAPAVWLALELFSPTLDEQIESRLSLESAASPLRRWILAGGEKDSAALLSRPLRLHDRITAFLLGGDTLDGALRLPVPAARWISPRAEGTLVWSDEQRAAMTALLARPPGPYDWLCVLAGSRGSGRASFATSVCSLRGVPLLTCDISALAASTDSDRVITSLFRELRLYDVALHLDGAEVLSEHPRLAARMRHELEQWPGLVFIASSPAGGLRDFASRPSVEIELAVPGDALRRALWLHNGVDPDVALQLAGLFRFLPGQIATACDTASGAALRRGEERASHADLIAACRALSSRHLVSFAQRVPLRRTWDDVVLPAPVLEQLRELTDQVRFRARVHIDWGFEAKAALGLGVVALFSGPSGTGKTLSAEVIAGALGLELYKIDLSSLISKYIGETEKNLARVFEDGEQSGGILFFDEADAVFGKRSEVKDAHDRYANIESSYLLQRIEEYPGVVILASNMGRNIDPAFQRRMQFVIEFPFPDAGHRRRIWKTVFPAAAPLDADVDFDFLSRNFALAGGHIRNVAVAAAFRAAGNGGSIGMEHLLRSLKREYQKMGKVCERSEFGAYYDLVR